MNFSIGIGIDWMKGKLMVIPSSKKGRNYAIVLNIFDPMTFCEK